MKNSFRTYLGSSYSLKMNQKILKFIDFKISLIIYLLHLHLLLLLLLILGKKKLISSHLEFGNGSGPGNFGIINL
jgi:hypothetical protein